MGKQLLYSLLMVAAFMCCLAGAYVVFDGQTIWQVEAGRLPKFAVFESTGQASSVGNVSNVIVREVEQPVTAQLDSLQLSDRLKSGDISAIKEYSKYPQWCYSENLFSKKPDKSCSKVAVAENDVLFQQQAERLAASGDQSIQLALGLWWYEKAKVSLIEYNTSAGNENVLRAFNLDNPAHNSDHSTYATGATLKKQVLEAKRWLDKHAVNNQEAAEALDDLKMFGFLR